MADPDLQIKGGGSHPDPEMGGGGPSLKKNFFQSFRPQFGLKIREGGPGRAVPLDPTLT